jgi:hypothetical protein
VLVLTGLVALLMLVVVAGCATASHNPPTLKLLHGYFTANTVNILEVEITNPAADEGDVDATVVSLAIDIDAAPSTNGTYAGAASGDLKPRLFKVSGNVANTGGTEDGTLKDWDLDVNTATMIQFTKNGNGQTMGGGDKVLLVIPYSAPDSATEVTTLKFRLNTTGSTANPLAHPATSNQTTLIGYSVKPYGVVAFTIDGATDGASCDGKPRTTHVNRDEGCTLSSNTTYTINATIRNRQDASLSTSARLTTNETADPASQSTTASVETKSDKVFTFSFKLNNTNKRRLVNVNVTGANSVTFAGTNRTINVDFAPDFQFNSTIASSGRFISGLDSAPEANQSAAVNVTWSNRGQADARSLFVNLTFANLALADHTSNFTVKYCTTPGCSAASAVSIPSGNIGVDMSTMSVGNRGMVAGASGQVQFYVFPLRPAGGATPDGNYSVNATFRYQDEHITNSTVYTQFKNSVGANPNGILVADSTKPGVPEVISIPKSSWDFKRGGAAEADFSVTVTDANLDPGNVTFIVRPLNWKVPTSTTHGSNAAEYADGCVSLSACTELRVPMNLDAGDTYKVTRDMAKYELVDDFDISVVATDKAGNSATGDFCTPCHILDNEPPTLTDPTDTSSGQISQGSTVRFSVAVNDNFRIGGNSEGTHGDTDPTNAAYGAGEQFAGVFLRMKQVETGNEFLVKNMTFRNPPRPYSNNGSYNLTLGPSDIAVTGNLSYTVQVYDAFGHVAESATHNLQVLSRLDLYFKESDSAGLIRGENYTQSEFEAHQLRPAVFGAKTSSPGSASTSAHLILENTGGGQDNFTYGCEVLSSTTVSPRPSCKIANGAANAVGKVTVFVTSRANGTSDPFVAADIVNGTLVLMDGKEQLSVSVTVPAEARTGDVIRINFTAQSKFVPGVHKTVQMGFVVSEGQGAELRFQKVPYSANTTFVKPTRTYDIPFLLRNPGNVPTTYELSLPVTGTSWTNSTSGVTFGASGSACSAVPSDWAFEWRSDDSRLHGRTITLQPAGNNLNQSVVKVRISIPSDANATTDDRFICLQAKVNDTIFDNAVLHADVQVPTLVPQPLVTGGAVDFLTVTERTLKRGSDPVEDCEPVPAPPGTTECAWEQAGDTFNFTVRTRLASTRNPSGANAVGRIQAYLLVQAPNGTLTNTSMSLLAADCNGEPGVAGDACPELSGRNGTYQLVVQVKDLVGEYRLGLYSTDGLGGDQLFYNPEFDVGDEGHAFFTVEEPAAARSTPGTTPLITAREVREEGNPSALRVSSDGFIHAVFGRAITVKVTMKDNVQVGRVVLRVERQVPDSSDLAPVMDVTMKVVGSQKFNGTSKRPLEAIYEGVVDIEGDPVADSGVYQFTLEGLDAVEHRVDLNSTNAFLVLLEDLSGPDFSNVVFKGGGASGANLTIERLTNVTIDATVADAGEASAGANVDPTTVRAALRKQGATTELFNETMTRDPNNFGHYNITIPGSLLNEDGTFEVILTARDLSGNGGPPLVKLLIVQPNLAPRLEVTRPALVGGVAYLTSTSQVDVTIFDSNLDKAAAGAITVGRGDSAAGPFTLLNQSASCPPAEGSWCVSGDVPQLTVGIGISTAGFLNLTAVDQLGERNSTIFEVRLDRDAPVASLSFDPLEPGKVFVGLTATYIAPGAKLLVSASDNASGLDAGAAVVVVTPSGGTPQLGNFSAGEKFTLDQVLGTPAGEGQYLVAATVKDRAGNTATLTPLTVIVDATPPAIGSITPANPLSVTVTDAGSGLRSVEILWSATVDGPNEAPIAMAKGSGDVWTGNFPSTASNPHFSVRAIDNVGNTADRDCGGQKCTQTISNFPPELTNVTVAPSLAGVVRGTVNVTWTATDPEGAQVVVSLKLRTSGGSLSTLSDAVTLQPYRWDTATVPDGNYTLVVTASDGALSASQEVRVTVRNVAIRPGAMPATIAVGESMLLSFQVSAPGKEIDAVQAIVRVGGEQETVTLFDDGTHGDRTPNDGVWSATYTPRLRGQATVDLKVTDSDGQSTTYTGVAAFTVTSGPVGGTPGTLIAVLALGVLVIAMGVFGLRRWR